MNDNDYGELKIRFDTVCMHEEELIAENARLRAALEAVEFIVGNNRWCPWCQGGDFGDNTHTPNCQRQIALGLAKEGEG